MIEIALSLAYDKYPVIRLNVIVGNGAEVFYDKLGFTSLDADGYMTKEFDSILN